MQYRVFSEDCFPQKLTAIEMKNYLYPFLRCAILLCFCHILLPETTPDSLQTLLISVTGRLHH